MPKVIQVIESNITRGAGTDSDRTRTVVQYHTLDGKILAEFDPCQCSPELAEEMR